MTNEERKAALEAIIYAADEPATIEQLAKALGEEKLIVQASLDELVGSYGSEERGIEIRAVAGGYKLYTKPQQHDVVRRFIKSLRPPLRLTMPALETLAVIAYKQPVTSPEISEIRGVNTSGVINTLLEKRLITTAGRKEVIGRPILYKTSKEFLMRFGLSDLEELPSLKEFEALAREALGSDEGVAEVPSGEWSASTEAAANEPVSGKESEPDVIATGQDLVVEGRDAENAAPSADDAAKTEETPTAAVPAADGDSRSTPTESLERVEQGLVEAEAWREHEALATAEGMPAGELDEDPLPPSVKSTAAGE